PFDPSGLRMGTPSITTRGMKIGEMEIIGDWIASILKDPTNAHLKKEIKAKVNRLCAEFPIYREF
ncbi:MAG TPA: serine hydroxymethyltransferase, partial [Candidatus Nanoarchaeia archaeon]|nr:serine hydroxymethyltransferase [Candidatus Nanoarchaeia archaeon]